MKAPGVGCGAAIVSDRRLLLVKRRRAPEAGSWNLPGGKVDFGERVAEAILREVREEVGLAIELLEPLGVVEMIDIDEQHWVSPIYLAKVVEGRAANLEPDKIEAVEWWPLDAPPGPLALGAQAAFKALEGGK